jgi:hypothetical protein
LYYAEVNVTITVDMTNVTLQKSSLQGYLFANSYYGYDSLTMNIAINSDVVLDSDTMQSLSYSCKSSKKKVVSYVDMEIRDNVIQLSVSPNKAGTTTLTIKIEGKTFKVKLKLTEVKISETSCLISKSGSKKLKISGYSGSVKWSSTRSSVATVSSNGTVKGKAYGNTVIVAKIGDAKVGCAVSVIPASLIKVCNRGRYMGTNWKYSQPLRTKNGYYDCSSLVWKAYKPYTGITFGSAGYPGTTVTESAWCKAKGRVLKGGFSYTKLQNMKINPGDIFFRSNSKKKAYSTTYHVEMFIGYECVGFDSDGKPVVASKWAARENGYDPYNGYIWARPMKY